MEIKVESMAGREICFPPSWRPGGPCDNSVARGLDFSVVGPRAVAYGARELGKPVYTLRRRQTERRRKLTIRRDVVAADHDVSWADRLLGARNGLAHGHRLLFRGAADAFPELGALRRRRYRGQRPCGGQEEQAAHFALHVGSVLRYCSTTCSSAALRACDDLLRAERSVTGRIAAAAWTRPWN